jgi:predicted DNA-binding transcriptional regulator AlpA
MLRLDEKILEAGVYSFRDLQSLGFVKDRTDLHRKQRKYGFPTPVKLGQRQAGFLRAEVHGWVRDRAAASRTIADHPAE